MKKFNSEKVYNQEHIGSFGKFFSGQSFPVEYLMTTFSASELLELDFARDIKQESLDFDLLMQRDIDEERVRDKIEPYLNPTESSKQEIGEKVVFFPPLLVAIVPTRERTMELYYPNETSQISDDEIIREWANVFKLNYFPGSGPKAYTMSIEGEGGSQSVTVDRAPVKLELRIVKGNELGAKLVVIDGQHRLFALKELYEKKPELIEELVVPICIIFSPNSTLGKQEKSENITIPTVPHVFRHLFVDVNTTMELVGGHFNILLSDSSIGSLVCRSFCDYLLNQKGKEKLAVIEWNTKTKKESTIIRKKYSVTSIGLIDAILKQVFSKNRTLVEYVLNLAEVSEDLYPNGESSSDYPKVEWEKFSLTQKKILDKQVKKYLVPCIEKIFFETTAFSEAYDIFEKELNALKDNIRKSTNDSIESKMVLDYVLEYVPIKDTKSTLAAQVLYKNLEKNIGEKRKENIPILEHAIFQRGIINAWASLLKYTKQYDVLPTVATDAYVSLLNMVLLNKGVAFNQSKKYIQYSIYSSHKIDPKMATGTAIGNLIIAFLGNKQNCNNYIDILKLDNINKESLLTELVELGNDSAGKFKAHYEKERMVMFKRSYKIDLLGLTGDQREELSQFEITQKLHVKEVRDGSRRKEDVSNEFDLAVTDYLQDDYNLAMNELKGVLGYSTDIVGGDDSNNSSDQGGE